VEIKIDLSRPDDRVSFDPVDAPEPVDTPEKCVHRWNSLALQVPNADEDGCSRVVETLHCPLCGSKRALIFVMDWGTGILRDLHGRLVAYPALQTELSQGVYYLGMPPDLDVRGMWWTRETVNGEPQPWKEQKA
jgi:hypothetical protein